MTYWGSLGALLGASWAILGPYWACLGPSWGSLGPSRGHLEAPEAHRKRKGEKDKNINVSKGFDGFWHLGGCRGGLEGHLDPSWGCLGASWMYVGGYIDPY